MKQSSTSLQLNWNDKSTLNNKRFADLERIPFFLLAVRDVCDEYARLFRQYNSYAMPFRTSCGLPAKESNICTR